jgi:dipeptidyl aminopeptidase/acylaminoacyl peptidase
MLIPRDILFGNPAYAMAGISPDGTRLHFLAPADGVMNVWVGPVDRPDAARPVTHDRGRGITAFGFCHDDRTLFYLRDSDGDESFRLYLLDLETGRETCATPFDGVQARVLAHNRWSPTTMLVGLNLDRRDLHDVYRLDLAGGGLSMVAANPGYLTWEIDSELRVRGGTAMRADGGAVIHLPEPWLEVPYEDVMGTRIVGYSRDGKVFYLLSSIGANASRLFAVDAATGERTLLAGEEAYDVRRVEFHPETLVPQAVVFGKSREERVFLSPSYEAELARIHDRLAAHGIDGDIAVDRCERTGRRWMVSVTTSDSPIQYHVYDRASGTLEYLFDQQPALRSYTLAFMEPFTFTARDGVEVHAYATWPAGAERRGLPAVVNVHGGPWARNSWGFDQEAQLLANRGYACVQVNFRGSTGFGKHFRNLAAKQWAAAMHTDLLDAIDHLAGAIDTSRVAIMGGSYGGYAALVGAAFTPKVFKCAIDLCGPSNLLTMLAASAPYRKPLLAFMYAHIGDPDTERDLLWQRSPLSRVDDIEIPILVAQGANDVRVTRAEAEQIVAALQAKDLPYVYLLFPDEGHGLVRPENRETYYAAVEAFLAHHLPTSRNLPGKTPV